PIAKIVLILFSSVFAFNCTKQENRSTGNSQTIQNLAAEQISGLANGITVSFPATLVKQSESNCIELFAQDDFKKYNGDGKHAIFSRFASESRLADLFEGENNSVVVTGKMIFVKDSTDISKTCGITTGQLFEITEIE
ncbi:MAG TPA: hypothetical protein VF599_15140, partial [Pyrinomonadaceae bacterium]